MVKPMYINITQRKRSILNNMFVAILATVLLTLLMHGAYADTDTIISVASNMKSSTTSIGKISEAIILVSGIGFIVSAFFKMHAHKNNPQQVPLTQAITLLVIGGALTVFPHLIVGVVQATFGTKNIASDGNSMPR